MKMSLLDIVQDILSEADSDEVNSIDDTTEALQAAQIVKTCYYDLITNNEWPHLKKLIQLDHSVDLNKPNYLKLPEKLRELSDFRYLKKNPNADIYTYQSVHYKYPDEFLTIVNNRPLDANVIEVVDFGGVKLRVYDNADPMYWTSFDDVYIVTDSYNSTVDDTLKKEKTQCLASIIPDWQRADDFIPDLPAEAFPRLLEEAKSTFFVSLKQMVNQKSEQKAARSARTMSRKNWRAHGGVRYADFGRKSRR